MTTAPTESAPLNLAGGLLRSAGCVEFDAWRDVVNVLLHVGWDMVPTFMVSVRARASGSRYRMNSLVTGNAGLLVSFVPVEVVLSLEQLLHFRSLRVELHPLLVDGLRDPPSLNTGRLQPRADRFYRIL